ncbi:MAG: enoyl-CoA hydratase/isomerase family protein [Chloroflexi bacterium]|nr:enoyl-CoA hydratase/isomerase family protein [Chloroflexota bacterium]
MAYEVITLERDGQVAVLTVNRPKVLNALNAQVMSELDQAIDEIAADAGVRAVVITGAGDRSFVAGADISELRALPGATGALELSTRGHRILFKLERLPKPVIAAINGFALGGGLELALACDIRIAAETARVGVPEVNLGLIPGYGGTQRLPRLVGKGRAKLMVLTGDHVKAADAERYGLVEQVVPADQLMPTALELAKKLASKAPVAVAMGKRAVNEGVEVDLDRAATIEAQAMAICFATEDRIEGTSAFLEKRPAEWKGR